MTLFTKPGCGLCDRAKSALERAGLEVRLINILEDDAAFKLYQYEIPVLVDDDGRELMKGVFTEARLASIVARG
ncbi:MAG: glutaredoxin family protein [Pleurocapsa sp. SU_196_0]|nr:glutaredoxin family protein [Pleurocapsa sp. SU_196_0]